MKGCSRRTRRLALVAASVTTSLLWTMGGGGSPVTAYAANHRWSVEAPCNIPAGDSQISDDVPGRAALDESALIKIPNTSGGDERCTWFAGVGGIPSDQYPRLEITAAVGDGTRLTVTARSTTGAVIATIVTAPESSEFRTHTTQLPSGQSVGKLSLTVDDYYDTAVPSRISPVLISDVRFYGSSGDGWRETFSQQG
jgi:hypothetical protein